MRGTSDVLRSHVRWIAPLTNVNLDARNNQDDLSSASGARNAIANQFENSVSERHANITINEHENINFEFLNGIVIVDNREPITRSVYVSPSYSVTDRSEMSE